MYNFAPAAHRMGISGAKSGPNSVKGEFMEQNEARGFVEDEVGTGTKTSLAQELEKAREQMRYCKILLLL